MPSAMFNKIMCAILLTLLCNNNIHCIEIEEVDDNYSSSQSLCIECAPTVAAYTCLALKYLTVGATLAASTINGLRLCRSDDMKIMVLPAACLHAFIVHKCINPFINATCALTDSKQYSAPCDKRYRTYCQKYGSKLQRHINTTPQAHAQRGLINSLAALSVMGALWYLKETDPLLLAAGIGFGWYPLRYHIIPTALNYASAACHAGIKKAGNFLK